MRIAWVIGWAVPASWFVAEAGRAWPEAEHVAVPAAEDFLARLEAVGAVDLVGGYSLGALLLLSERERVAERWGRAGLIAPIWAFPREAGRGGRVARAQVRALGRWARRDDAAARSDFYARAGLGAVTGEVETGAILEWGLAQLESRAARAGLPAGWFAAAGAEDALLDAAELARAEPGVRVVAGAGHGPAELVRAWARAETEVAA